MDDAFAPIRAALAGRGGASSDFDLNPDIALPPGRKLTEAAVLIPLVVGSDGLRLVLTKRSSRLRHHPGQIALPGGKRDTGDADLAATALREAQEEVGLDPAEAAILGQLAPHETVTGFAVTPFVAQLAGPFVARPEAGEVDEVFEVPFRHLADPARYRIERRRWRGRWRHYYILPWGPYYIWGATARILRGLAERLPR